MSRIISDSQTRREERRKDSKRGTKEPNTTKHAPSSISMAKQNLDVQSVQSQKTIQSLTSADAPSGPTSVSNQYCSAKDDNTVGESKPVRRNSKKNVINYIERNKKELDQANQKVKSTRKELEREQTVTLLKNPQLPIMETQD